MKLEVEMTEEQLNLLILSTEIYGRILMNLMFRDSYKSDTCRNLIDIWRVLRHLQYNISDNIDKSLYDVRASEPYHGGTEPLMRVRILEKLEVAGGERLGEKSNNTV